MLGTQPGEVTLIARGCVKEAVKRSSPQSTVHGPWLHAVTQSVALPLLLSLGWSLGHPRVGLVHQGGHKPAKVTKVGEPSPSRSSVADASVEVAVHMLMPSLNRP